MSVSESCAPLEVSPEKTWCPKCAAFQLASNPTCEKCGASMSKWAAPAAPASLAAKCVAGFMLLFFAGLIIAIFGAPGAAVLVLLGLLVSLGFLLKLLAQLAERLEKRTVARMPLEERAMYLARKQERAAAKQQAQATLVVAKQRDREAKERRREEWVYGSVNSALICPHCQTKGKVRTKQIDRKAGISGGKATAAVLTGGVSLLATGLSRKQQMTAARCGECGSAWQF
jgi:uncharacterized protein (DUF983 family)